MHAGQLKTALHQYILCMNLALNLFLIYLLLHCMLLHDPQHQALKYRNNSVNQCT